MATKYKTRLTIIREDGEFVKGDAGPDHLLTDAFVVASIVDDGGYDAWHIGGWDARTNNPVSRDEYYNLFANLAMRLSKEGNADWKRSVAELTYRITQHVAAGWHDRFCLYDERDCPLVMIRQILDCFNVKTAHANRLVN